MLRFVAWYRPLVHWAQICGQQSINLGDRKCSKRIEAVPDIEPAIWTEGRSNTLLGICAACGNRTLTERCIPARVYIARQSLIAFKAYSTALEGIS